MEQNLIHGQRLDEELQAAGFFRVIGCSHCSVQSCGMHWTNTDEIVNSGTYSSSPFV